MDGLELAETGHERGAEQDRRPEAARAAAVGFEHGRSVPATEAARVIEGLAKRDVVDALREDRLEPRRLGALPLPAQRTARCLERVGEVDVGIRPDRQPGHRRAVLWGEVNVMTPMVAHVGAACRANGGVTMGSGGSGTFR